MSAFQKAIALIGREAAKAGGYPETIDLTLYPDAATFARFHGGNGGDYESHKTQRAELVAWCKDRGIAVVDHVVTADAPASSADRAEAAVRARHKRPYRLGLSVAGSDGKGSKPAIGWMMVFLGEKTRKGEE